MFRSVFLAFVVGATLVLAAPLFPRQQMVDAYETSPYYSGGYSDYDVYERQMLPRGEREFYTQAGGQLGLGMGVGGFGGFGSNVYQQQGLGLQRNLNLGGFGLGLQQQSVLGSLAGFGVGASSSSKKVQYAQPIVTYAQPVVQQVDLEQPNIQKQHLTAQAIIQPTFQTAPLMTTAAITATAPTMQKQAGASHSNLNLGSWGQGFNKLY